MGAELGMLGQLPLENSGWRVGVGELGLESWGWRPGFRELGLESWVWMVGASQSFHRGLRAGWGAPPLPPPPIVREDEIVHGDERLAPMKPSSRMHSS